MSVGDRDDRAGHLPSVVGVSAVMFDWFSLNSIRVTTSNIASGERTNRRIRLLSGGSRVRFVHRPRSRRPRRTPPLGGWWSVVASCV